MKKGKLKLKKVVKLKHKKVVKIRKQHSIHFSKGKGTLCGAFFYKRSNIKRQVTCKNCLYVLDTPNRTRKPQIIKNIKVTIKCTHKGCNENIVKINMPKNTKWTCKHHEKMDKLAGLFGKKIIIKG